jgi:hypothetical protein
MQLLKTYGNRVEADIACGRLQAEGIVAVVLGVGVAMEGGAEGVRLLVPDEQAEAAREILGDS